MSIAAPRTIPNFRGPHRPLRYRMAASTTINAGDVVMINSAGFAVPCAAAATNRGCVGIASETKTSDASTPTYIVVYAGVVRLPGTSLTQAMVMTLVYGQADSSIGATGTNLPIAGMLVEFESASVGYVAMGPEYLS